MGLAQAGIALVDVEKIRDPERGRIRQQGADTSKVEIPGAAQGKLDVAHRFERHANDEVQLVARRFEEYLNRHISRDVMGEPDGRHQQDEGGYEPSETQTKIRHAPS